MELYGYSYMVVCLDVVHFLSKNKIFTNKKNKLLFSCLDGGTHNYEFNLETN